MKHTLLFAAVLCWFFIPAATAFSYQDAADFGFLPDNTGVVNTKALQAAVDQGGTIVITHPGTYKVAGTVYIGDDTSLDFGNGVSLEKSAENGKFAHVILNKGALTRTYNQHISITGLNLKVNGVENWMNEVYGLRGQIAFFYVKDLKIEGLRCLDLGKGQFCIHVCTFEDVLINDVIIKGKKDGIHFGPGKRFKVSNAVFQTADDALALVPGDWVTSNPEMGDLENGVIENCHDLKIDHWDGAFAKIVASAWVDWKEGIEVRHGDAVVSDGRIYRVLAEIDGKFHKSITQPTFKEGTMKLDGINWQMHQTGTIHTAVVRNVIFRDIYLESLRVPFQIMCYDNDYAHSYFKGAPMPVQGNIILDNVNVLNADKRSLMVISTPCDTIAIRNSSLQNNDIVFRPSRDFDSYPKTHVSLDHCTFRNDGVTTLLRNGCKDKKIFLKTTASIEAGANFSAKVDQGPGIIHVDSDLTGLAK